MLSRFVEGSRSSRVAAVVNNNHRHHLPTWPLPQLRASLNQPRLRHQSTSDGATSTRDALSKPQHHWQKAHSTIVSPPSSSGRRLVTSTEHASDIGGACGDATVGHPVEAGDGGVADRCVGRTPPLHDAVGGYPLASVAMAATTVRRKHSASTRREGANVASARRPIPAPSLNLALGSAVWAGGHGPRMVRLGFVIGWPSDGVVHHSSSMIRRSSGMVGATNDRLLPSRCKNDRGRLPSGAFVSSAGPIAIAVASASSPLSIWHSTHGYQSSPLAAVRLRALSQPTSSVLSGTGAALFSSSPTGGGGNGGTPPPPSKKEGEGEVEGAKTTAESKEEGVVNADGGGDKPHVSAGGGGGSKAGVAVRERLAQATKTTMEAWHTSDLLSVVLAVALLCGIVLGPYVVDKMKNSGDDYEDLVDDDITNLTKIIQDFSERGNDAEEGKGVVVAGLSDVVRQVVENEDVQASLTRMVVRVLKSPQVIDAAKVLVKDLFKDLVDDPVTTREVVALFRNVLADKETKDAVSGLVGKLCEDEDVYKAFTKLVVQIGNEEQVLDATRALLTESAHKTLTDPEILDHSMEFAADVVGDDVIQRTGGEALWNTISYSVRPAFSTMLYFVGASLVLFTFAALSKAGSFGFGGSASPCNRNGPTTMTASDSWASLSKNVHDSTIVRLIGQVLSFPLWFASSTLSAVAFVIRLPFKLFVGVKSEICAFGNYVAICWSNVVALPVTTVGKLLSAFHRGGDLVAVAAESARQKVAQSFVGVAVSALVHACCQMGSALWQVTSCLGHSFSSVGLMIKNVGACYSPALKVVASNAVKVKDWVGTIEDHIEYMLWDIYDASIRTGAVISSLSSNFFSYILSCIGRFVKKGDQDSTKSGLA